MNKHAKKKWVKALRSGKYTKTIGRLGLAEEHLTIPPGYCCLGVFVEEMAPEFVKVEGTHLKVADNTGYIPDDLAIMYDLNEDEQEHLASLNDENRTFGPIADYIEREL